MRMQLDTLRIFYHRRTLWTQMHSTDEDCRPPQKFHYKSRV